MFRTSGTGWLLYAGSSLLTGQNQASYIIQINMRISRIIIALPLKYFLADYEITFLNKLHWLIVFSQFNCFCYFSLRAGVDKRLPSFTAQCLLLTGKYYVEDFSVYTMYTVECTGTHIKYLNNIYENMFRKGLKMMKLFCTIFR